MGVICTTKNKERGTNDEIVANTPNKKPEQPPNTEQPSSTQEKPQPNPDTNPTQTQPKNNHHQSKPKSLTNQILKR